MLEPELGVQVTRVHEPERAVRALRRRAVEVLRREAVRDRHDRPVREPRELRQQPPYGLRCAHHDRGGRSELLAHPRQVAPAVEGARVHHHLVECPRVAEIGHPRLAEPARELGAGVRGVVGLHPDVDQVDVAGDPHAQLRAAVDPPLRPARAEEEPALRASAPARGALGLRGRGQAMHLELRRNLGDERLVLGRPAVRGRTAAGHDDRVPAELVQEASHAQRPLRARASDRREVVRVEEEALNELLDTRAMIGKVLEVPGWDSPSSARSASSPRAVRPSSAGAVNGTSSSRCSAT